MKLWSKLLAGGVVLVFLGSTPSPVLGATDWMTRPGTIGHALSLADGSHVYLDAVVADKIRARQKPAYFVVRECFNPKDRLVMNIPPPPDLWTRQTIDVEGILTTLPNGHRALRNVTVFAYLDAEGNMLYHGPLIKGLLEPTPWQWKTALPPDRTITTQDSPAPPGEPNPAPENPPIYCATIADAKAQSDGTTVKLECKPVDSTGTGYFVMAEDDTSDTLKVYYSQSVNDTDRINHRLPGAPKRSVYRTCSSEIQGMSVGWGDTYRYYLAGQAIDVTDLPDGDYELTIEVDPKKRLLETNDADNTSTMLLRISVSDGTVGVLGGDGSGPGNGNGQGNGRGPR